MCIANSERALGCRKRRKCLHVWIYLSLNVRPSLRGRGAQLGSGFEDIAIYRTAAAGRSKWLLEPARGRARNGCSSPLGAAGAPEMWPGA